MKLGEVLKEREKESCLVLPQRSCPSPQWREIITYLHPGYGGARISLGSAGNGNVLACLCHQVLGGMQEHGDHCAGQGKKKCIKEKREICV